MKKTLFGFLVAILICAIPFGASAYCGGRRSAPAGGYCNVNGCDISTYHTHNNNSYHGGGHHSGNGYNYR